MGSDGELLIDAPLVADPDADQEMGPRDQAALADEDLAGSRLLVVRRAVEAATVDGAPGAAVELACSFQPGDRTRFVWARVVLELAEPAGLAIASVQPHEVRENEPVRFSVDSKGSVGIKYEGVEAGADRTSHKEYSVYHCAVQGSGEGTGRAMWDFRENPTRRDGIGADQALALTLAARGTVKGVLKVTARLARPGLPGALEAVRDLVLGRSPAGRAYEIAFEVPSDPPPSALARFLRLA